MTPKSIISGKRVKPESVLAFVFGVRAQTEMKIWCITGMCMLKVCSLSETNVGVYDFWFLLFQPEF